MKIAKSIFTAGIALAALAGIMQGCVSNPRISNDGRVIPDSVMEARALFETNLLTEAIIKCTEIYRVDPLTPGLSQLQTEITQRIAELRTRSTALRQPASAAIAIEDADRQEILPDTYRLRNHVVGENKPIHALPPKMQKLLENPVSIHLEDVALSAIVSELSRSANVNIVADGALAEDTLTVHVDNVPLCEVFEYVGRNLGVTFAVGQNIIWVTAGNETAGTPPMYTRIYRLRKGLSSEEITGDGESIGIIEAVKRFVPEVEGADIIFNSKAHAILVKNTRQNLSLIEDIIEVLDVRPPQVLVEARFISTDVTDIRELGVDWFLDSSWSTSSARRGKDDVKFRTAVAGADAARDATGAADSIVGATINQTGFGEYAQNGLNFTYQGLLTDPAFHAVLHALEANGNTRTLSIPRVTTVNNKEAKVRIGKDIRYFENYEVEDIRTGRDSNGDEIYESRLVPSGTPEKEELGIELVVTPSVGADLSSINLKLVPEISDIVAWEYWDRAVDSSSSATNGTTMGTIKLPIFSRSTVETEVVVRSGETVVMGGLVKSQKVTKTEGVPLLSKIPLIGRFFRHDVTSDERSNLLIFVTATLISDSGEELIPVTPLEPYGVLGGPKKVELGEGKPMPEK